MAERTARAFWIERPGHGALRREPLPDPGPHAVVVRTRFSGISRGTESLVFQGKVPPTQYQAMRAPFQVGDFPAPVKYGYSSVGVVETGPEDLVGRSVFCLHPHQDLYVVPADAVFPLPEAVPEARAVLAANMETALNGCWDARPGPGDRIAIVGSGVVGCLVARIASRIPGCAVELVDSDPDKAALATALGVGFAAPEKASKDADLVVDASGAESGLVTALGLAGFEATVLVLSWFGETPVRLPLGEDFHTKRLVLRSSQVGTVPAHRRARWEQRRRLALTLELLDDPVLDVLISGESRFADLPQVMPRLAEGPSGVLCHRLVYD